MTRPTKDDLKREIDNLQSQYGADVSIRVAINIPAEAYTVTREPGEEDPIDSYTEPAIPTHLPPAYRGSLTVFDDEALQEVWDTMPEEVRDRERAYRREHDEPIPPILKKKT